MAQRCRVTGNAFEYMVCLCLQQRNVLPIDAKTKDKTLRLLTSSERVEDPHKGLKLEKLHSLFDSLKVVFPSATRYELNADNLGAQGDTADIVIHPCNIKLSIKNNNSFIKHQRANKLYLQLGLTYGDASTFQQQYKEINDRYHKMWAGLSKFKQVKTSDKFAMYVEINKLTMSWLKKDPVYLKRYLEFVLDSMDPNKYIIKWDARRKKMLLLQFDQLDQLHLAAAQPTFKIRAGSFLEIGAGDLLVKMRLHNASSRISNTLSMKYSTTIHACEDKFTRLFL